MAKKKTICIDDSQLDRLMTDTWKMAKGDNTDICPTVEEMAKEHVPEEVRIGKGKKAKKEKGIIESAIDAMPRKAAKKVKKSIVERLGSWGDLI